VSRREPVDAGFTLVEVLTSLAIIGVLLTAVTTFYVRSMVTVNFEGTRQAAVQVASTAMEQLREVPGALALQWLVGNAPPATVTVGRTTFTRTWDVPPQSALIAATVHVTWTDKGCAAGTCAYSATTLISTARVEPVFDPATT
jgi:prepilin-type N-terminal cleavage/methylation domain-containing protein